MAAMVILLALAAAAQAATVREDNTPLRRGCGPEAETVTALHAGAAVTIRFALSGESVSCYKVAAEVSGKAIEGYLPGSALEDLEAFDQSRREARWLDTSQVLAAIHGAGNPGLIQAAAQLIDGGQPARALALLEPELSAGGPKPGVLALAGAAAWRADDSAKALGYWRAALDVQPNPDLETLYRRVERENRNDRSTEKIYGLRLVLRYESGTVPVETARAMLAALDQEFIRISADLGCAAQERIVAIAQSREAYRKTTDAAEWNGGQFDGRIRVPVFQGQALDAGLRRVLAHETAHACLALLGHWPAWLHEGIAQKEAGDAVTPALRQQLTRWAREGKLPRLTNLHQDWSRLDTEHAQAAYALSLAAVELFYQAHGVEAMSNLLRNPDRMPEVTADLDRRLGL
jgi:hypothetical protein